MNTFMKSFIKTIGIVFQVIAILVVWNITIAPNFTLPMSFMAAMGVVIIKEILFGNAEETERDVVANKVIMPLAYAAIFQLYAMVFGF